jgi:predicted Zn-dependent protease
VKKFLLLLVLIGLLTALQFPFSRYMAKKSLKARVGFVADSAIMRFASADHKETIAALLTIKSFLYYGQLVEEKRQGSKNVDFSGLSRLLHTASRLDPYNFDIYYFPQAIIAWEPGFAESVVDLLDYGMKYRTTDYMLPFYAGFDSANFLRDFEAAAGYYKKAGDLTGDPFFAKLTAQYLFEANQTGMAIAYLQAMLKGATNPVVRKTYEQRLAALEAVATIERTVQRYKEREGKLPVTIEQLVQSGDLAAVPVDPFGGIFSLDADGRPVSTSYLLKRK